MKRVLMVLGILMWIPAVVGAQDVDPRCTQTVSQNGCVDWTNGLAIAIGTGAPASYATTAAQKNITAMRAAKLDAARNILELVKGVNISANSTVQGAMVANDTVQTAIQGRLAGLREVEKPKYFSDGSVQVKLEARLREVVPQELFVESKTAPMEIAPVAAPATGSNIGGGMAYSGLIIDARGTGVAPAMSPKVFDEHDKEVYGSAYVDREWAVQQGVVGYVKNMDQALKNDRVKGNPAVVKAMRTKGNGKTDLVLSQGDADALRNLAQQQTFLRESRVLILLD
ncbi:MAG: hypothetical protein OEW39_09600 [Deltaproteobacteria bacterium]|nr:hypothetical protein [Deltaproteobacteria bacterium]